MIYYLVDLLVPRRLTDCLTDSMILDLLTNSLTDLLLLNWNPEVLIPLLTDW